MESFLFTNIYIGIYRSNSNKLDYPALIWNNKSSIESSFISKISGLSSEYIFKIGGFHTVNFILKAIFLYQFLILLNNFNKYNKCIKNGNVIMWGIQTNDIYIIELKNEANIQESYLLSKKFQNWNINNFDADSNKFFTVISWNDTNTIIIKEPGNKPLMFQYSNKKNIEFWKNRIDIKSQCTKQTYTPILNPSSSINNLLSLKVYKDNLYLLVSSTMTQSICASESVLTIKDFNLYSYFPWNNEFLRIYATSIPDYPATLNIFQISEIPSALEYETRTTALPSVPLWFGQSICRFSIYNNYSANIQDYCSITCGLDQSQSPKYSISRFNGNDIKQMQINKTDGTVLSILPNTWEGKKEYNKLSD